MQTYDDYFERGDYTERFRDTQECDMCHAPGYRADTPDGGILNYGMLTYPTALDGQNILCQSPEHGGLVICDDCKEVGW